MNCRAACTRRWWWRTWRNWAATGRRRGRRDLAISHKRRRHSKSCRTRLRFLHWSLRRTRRWRWTRCSTRDGSRAPRVCWTGRLSELAGICNWRRCSKPSNRRRRLTRWRRCRLLHVGATFARSRWWWWRAASPGVTCTLGTDIIYLRYSGGWWWRSSSGWSCILGCFIGLLSSNPRLDKVGMLRHLVCCNTHLLKLVKQALLRGIVYIKGQVCLGRWSALNMNRRSRDW